MAAKILLIVLIIFQFKGFCQDKRTVAKADKFYEEKNYFAALKLYEEALSQSKKDPYINFRIASCYLLTSPKTRSLPFAYDAVANSPKPGAEMYFALGQAYHLNHQFDKAIEAYKKSDAGNANKKAITKLINECNFGKHYISDPQSVKITNAGPIINTEHQEYLPYITADRSRLYFTSRRPGSVGGKKDSDGLLFEDIYVSENKGGAWDKPQNVSGLNTEIHDACIGLAPDGEVMYIYKGSNGGDIYTSEHNGKSWTKPVPMPLNSELFETAACLSPDERTLYFVRALNTYANRDIYMCSKTIGGNWSKPKKVDGINTEYDEDAPFLHPDGKTLYFSSKGHTSMGGYDIFKCTKTSGTGWSNPVNIGYPINTAGDDVYFVLSADGLIGFYSTAKEDSYGKQDIYSIRMPAENKAPEMALLKGTVKDGTSGKALRAEITVTDNETKEVIAKYASNSETGKYIIPLPSGKNYGIAIEKDGHLFHSENVFLSAADGYKEVSKDIKLLKVSAGAKVVLNNIFFDSGKYAIREESMSELSRLADLLIKNPLLKIEITGHTDNVGDASANITLSGKRAEAIANYLIGMGIGKVRLVVKGYGSSQPLESNASEEGRQSNRRTEFKVL